MKMRDLKDVIIHDKVERMGDSLIQHGKLNNRIYLLKYGNDDPAHLLSELEDLALKEHYSKIFMKIPAHNAPVFISGGYKVEAFIPRFYNYAEDAFFLSKFFDPLREKPPINKLLKLSEILSRDFQYAKPAKSKKFMIRRLQPGDAKELSSLYTKVFKTYPFPVHDEKYILKTMHGNIVYYGAFLEDQLMGVSSSEMYLDEANAEMTDFAVLPEMRGNKIALLLLSTMEKDMSALGIKIVYTIARLSSIPMNVTFLKRGYKYAGTLINNTNISGKIESMNVLYNYLSDE